MRDLHRNIGARRGLRRSVGRGFGAFPCGVDRRFTRPTALGSGRPERFQDGVQSRVGLITPGCVGLIAGGCVERTFRDRTGPIAHRGDGRITRGLVGTTTYDSEGKISRGFEELIARGLVRAKTHDHDGTLIPDFDTTALQGCDRMIRQKFTICYPNHPKIKGGREGVILARQGARGVNHWGSAQ